MDFVFAGVGVGVGAGAAVAVTVGVGVVAGVVFVPGLFFLRSGALSIPYRVQI